MVHGGRHTVGGYSALSGYSTLSGYSPLTVTIAVTAVCTYTVGLWFAELTAYSMDLR